MNRTVTAKFRIFLPLKNKNRFSTLQCLISQYIVLNSWNNVAICFGVVFPFRVFFF
jgi:hypothetical protein